MRRILVLAVLSTLGCDPPDARTPGSARELELEVRRLITRQQVQQAGARHAALVAQYPEHPAALRSEARQALAEGRPNDALVALDAMGRDRTDRAEQSIPPALRAEEESLRAAALLRLGEPERALAGVRQARGVAPGHPALLNATVEIQGALEDWSGLLETAAEIQERGIAVRVDQQLLMARAYLETGAPAQAARALPARAENPRVRAASDLIRARIFRAEGRRAPAEALAFRALELAPDQEGLVEILVAILRERDRLVTVTVALEQAEARTALRPGGRLLLARIYAEQGRTESARTLLERIAARHPNLRAPRRELERLARESGARDT